MRRSILVFVLLFSVGANADLLQNGSLETVDNPSPGNYLQISTSPPNPQPLSLCNCLTGWEPVGHGAEWVHISNLGLGAAADGEHYIDLTLWADRTDNGGVGLAGIQQSFATVIGGQYTLTFSASSSQGHGRNGTGRVIVDVAGVSETFELNTPAVALNWVEYQVDFVAVDSITTVSLTNNQSESLHFSFIDNISIYAEASLSPVVIGDKEWRQPVDTLNIAYGDVATVCDTGTGACSGSIGSVDFSGWTWATSFEVGDMFHTIIPPHPGGRYNLGVFGSEVQPWINDWFALFSPTASDHPSYGTYTEAITRDGHAPHVEKVFGGGQWESYAYSDFAYLLVPDKGVWLYREPSGADTDGDSVPNDEDNCPDDANTDQADLDEDGVGDVCDDDADGDGELLPLDCNDLDPSIFTTAIEICTDGIDNDCDLLVDAADDGGDCDGDTVPNGLDNCPDDANPGQADLDNDGVGDVCDPDDDNDGYDDGMDNCPAVANDQADFDNDGVGDACDADADGDSVDDVVDLCLSTAPSDTDAGVPSKRLGKNRWADIDGDGLFDTSGNNPTGRYYTIDDTAGCNCAQIIEACGYGQGHTKHGCSNSVMDWWTGSFDREGEPPYQCKD